MPHTRVKYELTLVDLHVLFKLLCLIKRAAAEITRHRFVFGVASAYVAVMGRVRGEGFPTVFALKWPFT